MTENTLTNFVLSWNQGARPSSASSKYRFIDYHSSTLTDLGTADKRIICNTDSGILNTMMNGGVMGQTFNVDQVTQFGTAALGAGKSCLLYGYAHTKPDVAGIKALGAVGGVNPPAPDPTADPTEQSMGLDMHTVMVVGAYDPTQAKRTVKAYGLGLTNGSPAISLSWDAHTWKTHDGNCDGVLVAFWRSTKGWIGGYIEWCPQGRTGYPFADPLKNVYNNPMYKPWPIKGEDCGFCILSDDRTERSNVVFGSWPMTVQAMTAWKRRMQAEQAGQLKQLDEKRKQVERNVRY
jgi:hypothetical protein